MPFIAGLGFLLRRNQREFALDDDVLLEGSPIGSDANETVFLPDLDGFIVDLVTDA